MGCPQGTRIGAAARPALAGATRRQPSKARRARSIAASASSAVASATVVTTSLGRRVDHLMRDSSQSLEPPEQLPVGHRRIVGGQLDRRRRWRSGRPPRRRTPASRVDCRATAPARRAESSAPGARRRRRRRCRPGPASSVPAARSSPCSAAATMPARARYGLTSPPGTRFSTRSEVRRARPAAARRSGCPPPAHRRRGEGAGLVALVGVDVRRVEQGQLPHRGQQPGQHLFAGRRQARPARHRPAGAVVGARSEKWMWQELPSRWFGLAMKVKRHALLGGDLLGPELVDGVVVGRGQRVGVAERDLVLAEVALALGALRAAARRRPSRPGCGAAAARSATLPSSE